MCFVEKDIAVSGEALKPFCRKLSDAPREERSPAEFSQCWEEPRVSLGVRNSWNAWPHAVLWPRNSLCTSRGVGSAVSLHTGICESHLGWGTACRGQTNTSVPAGSAALRALKSYPWWNSLISWVSNDSSSKEKEVSCGISSNIHGFRLQQQ